MYERDGILLRQVNRSFAHQWSQLISSGFLDTLADRGWTLPFESRPLSEAAEPEDAAAVLRPEFLPFVSYPYEWTFGELKDAALLTLDIQQLAVEHGFRLRDASAFNIQFRRGRPILLDTLSLEPADPHQPWPAYRQFCQHFLGPLALMAYRDPRLGIILRDFIDGLPLDLACMLLPGRTRLSVGLGAHLHLHARAERGSADQASPVSNRRISRSGAFAIIDSLRSAIRKLDWSPSGTEWADYSGAESYAPDALASKQRLVSELAADVGAVIWDLGANTGQYARMLATPDRQVIAWDIDHGASERHYRVIKGAGIANVLPLVLDLMNPSPSVGWALAERRSLIDRAHADAIVALALLHHLALGANVPLESIIDFFAQLAPHAIVEFVPRSDPMAQRLLRSRPDALQDYTEDRFRHAAIRRYEVVSTAALPNSERVLYRLRRR